MNLLSEESVLNALRQIKDPDLHKDIVTLGFIRDLRIEGGEVSFRIVLTTPACPVKEQMREAAIEAVSKLPGVERVNVTMDAEVPRGRGIGNRATLPGVRNIIAVSSGKGGSANRPSPSTWRSRSRFVRRASGCWMRTFTGPTSRSCSGPSKPVRSSIATSYCPSKLTACA